LLNGVLCDKITTETMGKICCRPPEFTVMSQGKYLAGGLQSDCTANLYCLTISLAVKPDCITLTGSIA